MDTTRALAHPTPGYTYFQLSLLLLNTTFYRALNNPITTFFRAHREAQQLARESAERKLRRVEHAKRVEEFKEAVEEHVQRYDRERWEREMEGVDWELVRRAREQVGIWRVDVEGEGEEEEGGEGDGVALWVEEVAREAEGMARIDSGHGECCGEC